MFKVGDFIQHSPSGKKAWIINSKYALLWETNGVINWWSNLAEEGKLNTFRKTIWHFNVEKTLYKGLKAGYLDNLTYVELLARAKSAK